MDGNDTKSSHEVKPGAPLVGDMRATDEPTVYDDVQLEESTTVQSVSAAEVSYGSVQYMGVHLMSIMNFGKLVYWLWLLVLHFISDLLAGTVSQFVPVVLEDPAFAAVLGRGATESVLYMRVLFDTMPVDQSLVHCRGEVC